MTKKKKEVERKVIDIFWTKPLDKETILKLVDIAFNSKSKGMMIFEFFILLIIIAWLIALINYYLF